MAAGVAGGPTTGRNRRAARRSEEQVEVMHALWAEPHVTFKGKWHTIEDAGINPRPARSTCSASCTLTEQAGREPAEVGIEVWVSMGSGTEADWASETRFWKEAGCSHVTLTTNFNRRHHRRIPGRTMGDHQTALRRYHAAVADLL
jgi:hypothetical protein